MTEILSAPRTRQMPWEPDTSLLDAARRDRPNNPGAQRGSRARTTTVAASLEGTARDGSPANDNSPFAFGGLESDPLTRALVGQRSVATFCCGMDPGEPSRLGLLLLPSPR